ncbi:hypothetical protein M0R45_034919 [Rubus argutus]|uniref:Uncharacterized protein n=1 Tax=Rubus argutus TaxID=59490 RepID=A0AAW1VRK3_RUBAR
MNQRSIQGDETTMRKCKTAAVRRWSTGRGIVADRSNPSSVPVDRSLIASTGRHWSRAHRRPDRHSDRTESDRAVDWSRNMLTGRQFPEHLSTSRRPPRRLVDQERKMFPLPLIESKGDICRPIQPTSGPLKCLMVLVIASTYWSHVTLWSSPYAAYAKLLAQMIHPRAHYPNHPINSIRLDNAIRVYIKVSR